MRHSALPHASVALTAAGVAAAAALEREFCFLDIAAHAGVPRAGGKEWVLHLAHRVPASRRPQRPQPATVRRAVWWWLPGQVVVWREGSGERKSRVPKLRYKQPTNSTNALRGTKFCPAPCDR